MAMNSNYLLGPAEAQILRADGQRPQLTILEPSVFFLVSTGLRRMLRGEMRG
jgi:hypothetical protein